MQRAAGIVPGEGMAGIQARGEKALDVFVVLIRSPHAGCWPGEVRRRERQILPVAVRSLDFILRVLGSDMRGLSSPTRD